MPLTAVFVSFPDIHIETEVGDVMFFSFFFYRKERDRLREGRVGDVAIAPVLISITCLKNARKMRWIVPVGVIHNAWPCYLCGFRGSTGGPVNEMRAHWFLGKECRIFFLKCHVVKLWRVRYYFQEERLNSLPLRFFPSCLHPSPGGSRCASAILPLGGDSGQ